MLFVPPVCYVVIFLILSLSVPIQLFFLLVLKKWCSLCILLYMVGIAHYLILWFALHPPPLFFFCVFCCFHYFWLYILYHTTFSLLNITIQAQVWCFLLVFYMQDDLGKFVCWIIVWHWQAGQLLHCGTVCAFLVFVLPVDLTLQPWLLSH